MLTTWFASKERGTYWGLWNIAHNFGGFLAPIIAGTAAGALGWRWGMYVPGIMGIAMGLYVLFATSDSPEKAGFPPVEVIKEVKKADGTRAPPLATCKARAHGERAMCNTALGPVRRAGLGNERGGVTTLGGALQQRRRRA